MGGSKQARASQNKRRVNQLKQRRQVRSNNKVVRKIHSGCRGNIMHAPGPSKKKLRKNAKRNNMLAKYIEEKIMPKEEKLSSSNDKMTIEEESETTTKTE